MYPTLCFFSLSFAPSFLVFSPSPSITFLQFLLPYLHLSSTLSSFTFPICLPPLPPSSPFSLSLPLSEEIMQRLLDNMFSSESPSDSVIINGIAVILTILEKRCSSAHYSFLCCYGNGSGSESAQLLLLPLSSLFSFFQFASFLHPPLSDSLLFFSFFPQVFWVSCALSIKPITPY